MEGVEPEMGYALGRGANFDSKTAPATNPTNVGKINVNVHPCTFPVVASRRKEIPLTVQQSIPLALEWVTGNRFLSINEPTIANTVPMSSAGKKDCDKIEYPQLSVLLKLRCSTKA
jgi:hypothetical protein